MKVAILGLGVVGRGVYDILANDFKDITVKYIFDKDDNKTKDVKHLLAESYEQIINDREVEVVIELIGGKNVAYDFIVKAIKNHKNVVTANKALISERFKELNELAKKYNVKLLYEASVAGAVILIDPLKKIREINQINKIEGILNGSTNYILSKVFLEGVELKEAIPLFVSSLWVSVHIPDKALVRVVLPWSTCPTSPMLTSDCTFTGHTYYLYSSLFRRSSIDLEPFFTTTVLIWTISSDTVFPRTVFLLLSPFRFGWNPTPFERRLFILLDPSTSFFMGKPFLSLPPVMQRVYPARPIGAASNSSPIFIPTNLLDAAASTSN